MTKKEYDYDLESFLNFKKLSSTSPSDLNANTPTPPADKNVLLWEKLEKAIDLAKKKLKTSDELEIFRHISVNNVNRVNGQQIKNIKKDPQRLLNLIILHILDKEPIKYPSSTLGMLRNSKKIKIDLKLIKAYALANDTKKILQLLEAPDKKIAKVELVRAIKNDNLEQMFYWFEKLKEILVK